MKRLTILLTAMVMALTAAAQEKELEWPSMPKEAWGVRVGGRLGDMSLSYAGYDEYAHSLVFGPSLGLYSRHRLNGPLALRTDVVYTVRGVDLSWCDVQYSLSAPYLDFRPMLQYNLARPWWEVVPYVTLGFECSLALPGKITYQSNSVASTSIALNKSNFSTFDLGLWAGVGVDFHFELFDHDLFLFLEAGGDLGLLNTFASAEQSGDAVVLNPELGNPTNIGTRKNRGIEVALGLVFPFGQKKAPARRGGRAEFDLEDFLRQQRLHEGIDDDSTGIADLDDSVRVVPKRPVKDYEYKDCYTLEEILDMIDRNKEVCDLRICLFDINFAFDSYNLTLGSKRRLDQVVRMLKEHPEYNLHVNGHTDSIGSDEYNDRLSLYRASEVVSYFIRNGINGSRLSYAGFGEHYPIESNATEEGRYHNRRVELELYCNERKK